MTPNDPRALLGNHYDVELPTGLKATVKIPQGEELIVRAGDIPFPVLEFLTGQKKRPEGVDPTAEEMAHHYHFRLEVIAATLVAIDGEPVSLTRDDVKDMHPDDADFVYDTGVRKRDPRNPVGKA